MGKPIVIAALLAALGVQAGDLQLEFHGKGLAGNPVRVAVYSADAREPFPSDEKYYRGVTIEATTDRLSLTIPGLPAGKYALAAYVDSNRNGKRDQNFLGIPTERVGFSNDARGKFGPPDFADAAFEIGDGITRLSIHLH